MFLKIVLSLFIVFMGIATSPVHSGEIISCDSFEQDACRVCNPNTDDDKCGGGQHITCNNLGVWVVATDCKTLDLACVAIEGQAGCGECNLIKDINNVQCGQDIDSDLHAIQECTLVQGSPDTTQWLSLKLCDAPDSMCYDLDERPECVDPRDGCRAGTQDVAGCFDESTAWRCENGELSVNEECKNCSFGICTN